MCANGAGAYQSGALFVGLLQHVLAPSLIFESRAGANWSGALFSDPHDGLSPCPIFAGWAGWAGEYQSGALFNVSYYSFSTS